MIFISIFEEGGISTTVGGVVWEGRMCCCSLKKRVVVGSVVLSIWSESVDCLGNERVIDSKILKMKQEVH